MPLTLSKNERLHRIRAIHTLFSEGKTFSVYPFKLTWMKSDGDAGDLHQVMISIPKTVHKKSSDRNLIRRRIREVYRQNKSILYHGCREHSPALIFCITCFSKEILTYRAIHDKINLLLQRLHEECEKSL